MRGTAKRTAAGVAVLGSLLALPANAGAIAIDVRTFRISAGLGGIAADGSSARPSLSAAGGLIAFDTAATNLPASGLNGTIRDVLATERASGRTALMSAAPDGSPANGDSTAAAVAGNARRVAFVSAASNLVAGDGNGQIDVFVRDVGGGVQRVSVAADGSDPNGPSSEPDMSHDGRFVAFSSAATNLVPGDTNGQPDVFVRDLSAQITRRISVAGGGVEAQGASRAPALAASGLYASFESSAANLVGGDTNGIPDVFKADLRTGHLERVTVSSGETQQNKGVIAPFAQVSDISTNGRRVVFESDATNLVSRDRNDDTDVFVRDTGTGRTERVSLAAGGLEAFNDSFSPSISPNGRYVAFESFAENLAPGDARGEDVFIHDREIGATVVANVTANGRPRSPEGVRQLLQRPVMSADAKVVGFASTANNLTAIDNESGLDVFVRLLDPPRGAFLRGPRTTERTSRPAYAFRTDDPAATDFLCTIDGIDFQCRKSGRLPALRNGRHTLTARAGGPGLLFEPTPIRKRFRVAVRR